MKEGGVAGHLSHHPGLSWSRDSGHGSTRDWTRDRTRRPNSISGPQPALKGLNLMETRFNFNPRVTSFQCLQRSNQVLTVILDFVSFSYNMF